MCRTSDATWSKLKLVPERRGDKGAQRTISDFAIEAIVSSGGI